MSAPDLTPIGRVAKVEATPAQPVRPLDGRKGVRVTLTLRARFNPVEVWKMMAEAL